MANNTNSSSSQNVEGKKASGGLSRLGHMSAGASAGFVSRSILAPLDVVKIRFQVQPAATWKAPRASIPITGSGVLTNSASGAGKYTGVVQALRTIAREEGLRALWKGNFAAQLMVMPFVAFQFASFDAFKRRVLGPEGYKKAEKDKRHLPFHVALLGGGLSGALATVVVYPMDIARTVLASQGEPRIYKSVPQTLIGLAKESGVRRLYAGLGMGLLQIGPYISLQFATHAWLSNHVFTNGDSLSSGAAGLIAGGFSKALVLPVDVVKKRLQIQNFVRGANFDSTHVLREAAPREVAASIWAREGILGFYKGAVPSVIKSAPATAITFFMYDLVKRALLETEWAWAHRDEGS